MLSTAHVTFAVSHVCTVASSVNNSVDPSNRSITRRSNWPVRRYVGIRTDRFVTIIVPSEGNRCAFRCESSKPGKTLYFHVFNINSIRLVMPRDVIRDAETSR